MKLLKIFPILCSLLILGACGNNTDVPTNSSTDADYTSTPVKGQSAVSDDESSKNVLQVALGSKDHTTLVAAVQAAGLEDVLVNAGPLTVFAPTNAAFEALPAGTVEDLLKPENKSKLSSIIKYHASPGNYQGNLLKDGMRLYQASGHYVKVEKSGEDWLIDGAKILGTVPASNGVVHVVDKVMLPE
ncbi:MAG: fasciclin domain-containing protein [Bacteroidota bacterium]